MVRNLMILLMAVVFLACNSPSSNDTSKAEEKIIRKPTAKEAAADKRMSNMTIPPIGPVSNAKPEDIKTATSNDELTNHPLVDLSKPEDTLIIRYLKIQDMEWACWSDKPKWRQRCGQLIKEAILKCDSAGIKTAEADFRNRAFVERQMRVMEKQRATISTMTGAKSINYTADCQARLEKFKQGELLQ